MAQQGQAPRGFARVSRVGVPWMTVLVMTVALLGGGTLFLTLDANRRALTAPATRPTVADMAATGSRIPDLQVPAYEEAQPLPAYALAPQPQGQQ
ncbi:hypothetical protein LTR94_036814, partial [Friedmanniomyces endolithicus]